MKDVLKRLKSWAVWVSLLGAIGIILNSIGMFEKWGLTSEGWQTIIDAIGGLLVAFGILNNPTDKENF